MSSLAEQLAKLQRILGEFPLDYQVNSDHTELLLRFLSCLSQTEIRAHESILNNSKFKEGDLVKVDFPGYEDSPPVQGYGSVAETCLQYREPDLSSVGVYYEVVLTRDLRDKPCVNFFYVEEKYISLVKEND